MKYFSHLNTAVQLLQQYSGKLPFGIFIKQYFSGHKKYGSKDRKNISQLCYSYFRLGKALQHLSVEEQILTGLFLCSNDPNELLQHLKPEWNEVVHLSLKEKFSILNSPSSILNVFPWKDELSEGIDHEQFCASFFIQPNLFLRVRPGKEQVVTSKLEQAGISFSEISNSCLALPNASKVDAVIEIDKEAVVQDYSSQRIGEFIEFIGTSTPAFAKATAGKPLRIWDACAASGGKSILAHDLLSPIDLTVSDVRESILVNLKKRFAAAGIKHYHQLIADLSTSTLSIQRASFDIIITDIPCSGSGTWSRTPEQLHYFNATEIDRYSALQKKIVQNVIPHIKPGGWLLYCTCSVFKKENEEMVQFLTNEHHLKLHKSELLKGYDQKADTLFAALFTV
jgi:16S rRNA (cytosine967-C5)-methyltransferase